MEARNYIDLRSDTVTLPDDEMRRAMSRAPVGDDVFGEDPSVRALEEKSAAMVGKEAALFVASGTMGNLIAVLTHTARGNAVLLDPEAHIFYYEAGGASLVGGIQLWPVVGLHSARGVEKLLAAIRPPNLHFAPATLLCLENTHNRQGGSLLTPEESDCFYSTARKLGLKLHLDGARIFNAATALGCPVTSLTRSCDSVMFCLSKGLGAPVGSILAGTSAFIEQARRYRKILGGGMRQAGILAAAGLIALERVSQLKEDHRRARNLAAGLNRIPGLKINPFPPPTNIVLLETGETGYSPEEITLTLQKCYGIKVIPFGKDIIRMIVHRDITDEDVAQSICAFEKLSEMFVSSAE